MTSSLAQALVEPDHKWYSMEANTPERTAEIILYGAIGGWYGVQAVDFVAELADLDVDTIELRVNSPGGSAYDGIAIMNALHRHKARVVATVDGLAASAASVIVQAADELVMGRGSELMIHDASNIAWGNAGVLRKEAEHLDRLSQSVAGIYAERAGGTADEWREAMLAETWYSAQEAVDAGLADRVEGKADDEDDDADDAGATNSAAARYRAMFAHAGRADAPAPHVPQNAHRRSRERLSLAQGSPLRTALHLAAQAAPTLPAEPEEITNPNQKGASAMTDLIQGLRERLGIKADAKLDEDGLLAALDEVLEEQATETTQATTTAPEGTVLVDKEQYATLQADAKAGREAREEQLADARRATVDLAVREGRIPPARREYWENQLEHDPGAKDVLEAFPKGSIPIESKGYTGGVDESSDDDGDLYVKTFGPTAETTKEG
ncbi:head maturation protease, ClpP-related [Cellulosimicrobium cellulans]